MKIKHRLNVHINTNLAVLLKAHATMKGITLGEAVEDLLKEPIKHVKVVQGDQVSIDLKKIDQLHRKGVKAYREGKTIPIKNLDQEHEEMLQEVKT